MTGTRDPQQDGSIQAMLRDASLEASTELRGSLEQLRALLPDQPPAPRADLAALLAAAADGSPAAGTTPIPGAADAEETLPAGVASLAERRRSRNRRLAVVGGAVIGAMTLGAGAVAASNEGFRRSVGLIFQTSGDTADRGPATDPATVPAGPSPSDVPALNPPTSAAAETPGPAVVPSAEVPTAPGAGAPGTNEPATPPAAGPGGVLPLPAPRPSLPSLPPLPDLPRDTAPEKTPDNPVPTLLNPGGFPPAR
jgi:hypothetical protein